MKPLSWIRSGFLSLLFLACTLSKAEIDIRYCKKVYDFCLEQKLTDNDCGTYAVDRYQGGLFSRINEYLRTGPGEGTDDCEKVLPLMIPALRQKPVYDAVVWRGTHLPDSVLNDIQVGGVFYDAAFLSTSRNRKVGLNFAANVLFKIRSKTGRILRDFGDEKEILFAPGTEFRIRSVKMVKKSEAYWFGSPQKQRSLIFIKMDELNPPL